MDIKNTQKSFKRMKVAENQRTANLLKLMFSRKSTSLDFSNHYFFKQTAQQLYSLFKAHKDKSEIKHLVFKNCMLSGKLCRRIIKNFMRHNSEMNIKTLDLGNNRLKISPKLSILLSLFFKSNELPVSLIFQGNLFEDLRAMRNLFEYPFLIQELNFYDSNLSDECLGVLSRVIAQRRSIRVLNLSFNPDIFQSLDSAQEFATSVAKNPFLEDLVLNGLENLGIPEIFSAFISHLSMNATLTSLSLASVGIEDSGVPVLCEFLQSTVCSLNLENNSITAAGITELMRHLPESISKLDISYNEIRDSMAILSIAGRLLNTRSLRNLNMSHTMELEDLDERVIEKLCEALTKNDSLTELYCEGVKISENPDNFCLLVNQAISVRSLSLTYKISAVNCTSKSSILRSISLNESHERIISNRPSEPSLTEKIDSSLPSKEIICTSRQFNSHNFITF